MGTIAVSCAGASNSTGAAATLAVTGGVSRAANQSRLLLDGGPPRQPVLVTVGDAPADAPLGNGRLCVGGAVANLGRAQRFDAAGHAERVLDLSVGPLASVPPGVSLYFQALYRDPAHGGASFNLSGALELRFCP